MEKIRKMGADSIAFPRLGCGNGNLDWEEVRPLMEKYLKSIPMQIYIYVGNYKDPKPEHLDISEMEKWINGEAQLEGYEKFSRKFHNCVRDNQELKEIAELQEATICSMWNFIRDAGIVKMSEIPYEYQNITTAFMNVMEQLRYVSKVIVSQDGKHFAVKPNAY